MTRRLLVLGLALAAAAAFALDPPERAPVPSATATQQDGSREAAPQDTPSVPEAPPPTQAEDEQLPPLPPGTRPPGPTPQRFNPTEKVRADFPVSFPIDI